VVNPGTATDLYYSSAWQVLEEQVSGVSKAQYVWSPVYVDALVLRDRDADGNSANGLEERLYVQQDANWNVTALVNTTGTVVERYDYDPYGKVTFLNASWGALSGSAYAWIYLHQGGRFDGTSNLYYFRNRDYSPTLGRWTQVDPIGLTAGDSNFYRYVSNNPLRFLDPAGAKAIRVEMDAFINRRLGKWNKEPQPWSQWYFEGDDRDFGGSFERSRLRSWFTIDSCDIGYATNDSVKVYHDTGWSQRRQEEIRSVPGFDYPVSVGYIYQRDKATARGSQKIANGVIGTQLRSTRVTATAAASYPFSLLSPDIDYTFYIYFYISKRNEVRTKIGAAHNSFPDYEVIIDGTVVYKYRTDDTGPGLFNLTIGDVKRLIDGPIIDAPTK
jgi:RHS repeat-associated protein